MGETFAIQIPYAVIVDANKHLAEVNVQAGLYFHQKGITYRPMETLYALSVNKETGMTRVEGKVQTSDGRLDIDDFELPLRLPTAVFDGEVTHPRYIRLFDIPQCVANVVGWSTERGILANGKWQTQITKYYEEDGEAATGISKTKHRLIMNGLGDALVVMTNVLALSRGSAKEIASVLEKARQQPSPLGDSHYLFHKMRLHTTLLFDLAYEIHGYNHEFENVKPRSEAFIEETFQTTLLTALGYMNALANAYDMSLEKCFSLAWDEIKDRKGFLNADGIFIKEADMTAEQKAAHA